VQPVLILGAGINGCAVARDLATNGVPVVVVDKHDIAYGATSRSSRLIHGGLRYLEYRDIRLVRESLRERELLLRHAPQFVRPIRLSIPIQNRFGGLLSGALNYLGLGKTRWAQRIQRKRGPRGLWAVRVGLMMYDALADTSSLPRRSVHATVSNQKATASDGSPNLSDNLEPKPALASAMRWVCGYSDAQMELPERFCLALLHAAKQSALNEVTQFEVLTRHECKLQDGVATIHPIDGSSPDSIREFRPSVIVNATGASGDQTLASLGVEQPQILAGTKGTHLFTTNDQLKAAIGTQGIYTEASDGRLVFILPCRSGALIGTTDEHFSGTAEQAISTDAEVEYLIGLVNGVFPSIKLNSREIEMAHAGVRPLPYVKTNYTSEIPRGHAITVTVKDEIPILTLVGGKLTTCRSLAEEVTNSVLGHSGLSRKSSTRDQYLPGAENWPDSASELDSLIESSQAGYGLTEPQVKSLLELSGNRLEEIFSNVEERLHSNLSGTQIPIAFVKWSIENEWVRTLDDLAERRLALVFVPQLGRSTLVELAELLVEAGRLDGGELESAVDAQIARFETYYSKAVLLDG
jgi:glycerol-3-phosphate dehydrogenase